MISMRRILRLKICPSNSLPSTLTHFTPLQVGDHCLNMRKRRLPFNSFCHYGTEPTKRLTEDRIEQSQHADLNEAKERYNRESATVHFMLNVIRTLAVDLLERKYRFSHNVTIVWDDAEDACYKYWLAIFELSENPLAIELKEKLLNSGIPYEDFCFTINEIVWALKERRCFCMEGIHVTPQDVRDTIARLDFDRKEYDYLKILFSLHEIHGMKI